MFDWHVQVERPAGFTGVRIFIWRKHPDGIREFLVEGGKVSKTIKDAILESKYNDLVFATIQSDEVADLLLATLQNSGFTLPKADHTAGKLEATERHLDDMRKLVFKEKK